MQNQQSKEKNKKEREKQRKEVHALYNKSTFLTFSFILFDHLASTLFTQETMATSNSTATGKSDGAKQASVQSKDAVPRRRMNIQMVQNVLLIWLDKQHR